MFPSVPEGLKFMALTTLLSIHPYTLYIFSIERCRGHLITYPSISKRSDLLVTAVVI